MNSSKSSLLIFVIASQFCLGQDRVGSISGKVIDLDTKVTLSQVNLLLYAADNRLTQTQISDANGLFNFKRVSPGTYKLTATFIAYQIKTLDSLIVLPDSTLTLHLQLDPYFGHTAEEATKDLSNNVVRIYVGSWFLVKGQLDLANKYGFDIVQIACDPMIQFDRYNSVVYSYLDRINGPGWFDKYMHQLDSLKVLQEIEQKTRK